MKPGGRVIRLRSPERSFLTGWSVQSVPGEIVCVCRRRLRIRVNLRGREGIVNIDPENVLTPDEGGRDRRRSPHPARDISTAIPEAMTHPGVVLGTAACMLPEQARGKPVDKRAGIWAFGCILFECLAGRRAFKDGKIITSGICPVMASHFKGMQDRTLKLMEALIAELRRTK